jgi:Domain of unknown function (DUF4268)
VSSVVALGRLESVPLRSAWPDEARNFTPWLAEDTNLAFLGETLGLQLELETTEKSVGAFSADILAKEVGTDRWVLIENQFGSTDHTHLGQLLTYAAGLDAKTVVWISENFREEHRAAIDFLNNATSDEYFFFGVQIELYRIGESSFAPQFSVRSQPNQWTKRAQRAKQTASDNLSPTEVLSRQFWQALIDRSATEYPQLASKTAQKLSWQTAETIRSGKGFYVAMNAAFTRDWRLRVEIYIGGPLAKAVFQQFEKDRVSIEQAFGMSLEWEELPSGQDSRIAYYLDGKQDRTDRILWDGQQTWLLENWPKLANAIRPFAAKLNAADLSASEVTFDTDPEQ